ncbi:MAG TPA: alpha-hydroxy acid oxidase, partial [Terriglobia bacterium]|nr:alpha-hydroxy acid oxidase [Terriglobia bacterium]
MDYLSLWNTLAGCFPLLAAARAKPPKAAPGVSGPGAGQRHPPINVFDFEALARRRLSRMAFEYVDAGAGDEITLRRNRECLDGLRLQPRVLVGAEKIDTTVELFGERLASPLLLAPCAYQKVLHPEGELATARAAAAAQTTMVVSTFATVSLEQIAGAAPARRWFQLYVQPDHGFTRELVQRAEAAGYQVLVITVDTPMLGVRDRERRSGFRLPAGIERANLKPLGKRLARLGHFEGGGDYYLLDPAICWKTIDWIL